MGGLDVTIAGLPSGVSAVVTVTGPSGFVRTLTASGTITGLTPGSYTIAASNVTQDCHTYTPSSASQTLTVAQGQTTNALVSYSTAQSTGGALNLCIAGMYLTQSSQTLAGSVPLVKDRAGYLRVFVQADQANVAAPAVRVRFYIGGVLANTMTISSPSVSVPMSVDEGSLSKSWNVAVPGSLIQPGLSILTDVDPDGQIAEANENDNNFPSSGTPLPLNVQTAPRFSVLLVPVHQTANGLTGDVSDANKDHLLSMTQKMHPLPGYDAVVHAPYTTSKPALDANDANGAWAGVLAELNALRAAESDPRTYYGVVKTSYNGGVAGLGYIGWPVAMGWDYSSSGPGVAAHELGHTWGREHAPCGNPDDPDPAYPYAGGRIGVYGLDVASATLKSPTTYSDIMGYCLDAQWISDYTYRGVLSFRTAQAARASAMMQLAQPCLLVWGHISEGRATLEPAFDVTARPSLPRRSGPYSLEGLSADGRRIFSISFDGEAVADARTRERHFAYAIPLDDASRSRLSSIRLSGIGQQAQAASAKSGAEAMRVGAGAPVAARVRSHGHVMLQWNQADYPAVMVRDPQTGEVLSFARGGAATVYTTNTDLDVTFSDRVHSFTRRVTVTQ